MAIIGLSHAKGTADKLEAGLREISVNMAEQVVALQTELGALQRELNASIEYWKTLQMQQAVSTKRLINNSIAHLEQHFRSALTQQNNDLRRAITQQNNDLQMTKSTVSNNVNGLSQTRTDVNQLNSKLHTHINRDRDDTLQRDINRVSAEVSTELMAIRNDVNQLRTQVLSRNNSYHS